MIRKYTWILYNNCLQYMKCTAERCICIPSSLALIVVLTDSNTASTWVSERVKLLWNCSTIVYQHAVKGHLVTVTPSIALLSTRSERTPGYGYSEHYSALNTQWKDTWLRLQRALLCTQHAVKGHLVTVTPSTALHSTRATEHSRLVEH